MSFQFDIKATAKEQIFGGARYAAIEVPETPVEAQKTLIPGQPYLEVTLPGRSVLVRVNARNPDEVPRDWESLCRYWKKLGAGKFEVLPEVWGTRLENLRFELATITAFEFVPDKKKEAA